MDELSVRNILDMDPLDCNRPWPFALLFPKSVVFYISSDAVLHLGHSAKVFGFIDAKHQVNFCFFRKDFVNYVRWVAFIESFPEFRNIEVSLVKDGISMLGRAPNIVLNGLVNILFSKRLYDKESWEASVLGLIARVWQIRYTLVVQSEDFLVLQISCTDHRVLLLQLSQVILRYFLLHTFWHLVKDFFLMRRFGGSWLKYRATYMLWRGALSLKHAIVLLFRLNNWFQLTLYLYSLFLKLTLLAWWEFILNVELQWWKSLLEHWIWFVFSIWNLNITTFLLVLRRTLRLRRKKIIDALNNLLRRLMPYILWQQLSRVWGCPLLKTLGESRVWCLELKEGIDRLNHWVLQ